MTDRFPIFLFGGYTAQVSKSCSKSNWSGTTLRARGMINSLLGRGWLGHPSLTAWSKLVRWWRLSPPKKGEQMSKSSFVTYATTPNVRCKIYNILETLKEERVVIVLGELGDVVREVQLVGEGVWLVWSRRCGIGRRVEWVRVGVEPLAYV
ncbi:unnamed protein product, partial [Dovyalis caffra]